MKYSSSERPKVPIALKKELEIEELKDKNRMADNENLLRQEHIEYLNGQYGEDDLTGLASRKVFEDALEQSIKMGRRGASGALISIDIDKFKEVNDTPGFGHQAGDEVLRRVAKAIKECVREVDIVGRPGGDELGVILSGTDDGPAGLTALKIRDKIEKLSFEDVYPGLHVTASFGVISLDGSIEAAEIKRLVDIELYKAKNGGRNQVSVYGEEGVA